MFDLPGYVQIYAVIILVGLLINVALIIHLLRWDPRNKLNRLMIVFQVLLAIWSATSLINMVLTAGTESEREFLFIQVNGLVNYLGSGFVGCSLLNIALSFPQPHPVTHRKWFQPLLCAPNAFFYIMRLTNHWHEKFYLIRLDQGQYTDERGPIFWYFIALSYSQVLLGIVIMLRTARRSENDLQRNQILVLVATTSVVFAGHVVRARYRDLFPVDPSLLCLTLGGLLYFYGVLRYRLLGIAIILRRAVVYSLTWIILAALLFVTFAASSPLLSNLPPLGLTILVLLSFGLLSAARTWVDTLVDHSLNPGRRAYRRTVQEFTEQLTIVSGSDQLLPSVVDFVVETMYAESGAIIVQDRMTGDYLLRYSRGFKIQGEAKYRADDPFFAYLRGLERGDVLELSRITNLPRYHEIRNVAEEHLHRWRAEICLVLKVQDELVGIITLGPRSGKRSYGRADLRLFSQIARQMAISVYNVLYYDAIVAAQKQLKSLAEELEIRVRERTQRLEERTQELIAANQELRQAQEQIIQSEKLASIGQLAAGVAHEINNPVGVILGFSQFLQRHIPSDDICAGPLATIEQESLRCKQIVKNLLDFARIGQVCLTEVDLHQTLEATCQLLEYQLAQQKVELVKNYALDLPTVRADPQQIQQVFVNIVLNAYQAMPQGGRLEIKTWVKDDKVAVAFSDEGEGIPAEHQNRIFDPFFTTKEAGKGTGLGLSVSYGIVHRHGGHIDVESQMGHGSTFIVRLPISQETGQDISETRLIY